MTVLVLFSLSHNNSNWNTASLGELASCAQGLVPSTAGKKREVKMKQKKARRCKRKRKKGKRRRKEEKKEKEEKEE